MSDTIYYSPEDFIKSSKFDAHIHYDTFDDSFLRKAGKANIRLLSINTDTGFPIDTQFEIGSSLKKRHPQSFNFIGTFDATVFASGSFAEDTMEQIRKCVTAGARGIKIWKNIGMVLKNEDGQHVMADDPVFDPIYAFLEKEKIPLLAHLGEPRNCWLPYKQMTIPDDVLYYHRNPSYHLYMHPEIPSYERQIEARDHILERYPNLIFVGAHLGSMEWSLEEVAKRMDRFPNFFVDLSGRFGHIFEHAFQDRSCVVNFFEKYQNRILYGSDWHVSKFNKRHWMKLFCKCFPHAYMELIYRHMRQIFKKHWLFLATDQMIKTGKLSNTPHSPEHLQGLRLPRKVVDRIFYENAVEVYLNEK